MKHHVKRFISHPLIYGSGIVVFGGLVANFFNFLFNLFMSRNLSFSDYGTLATIISLATFPALIINSIIPVVVRFAGEYFAHDKLDLVKGLYDKLFRLSVTIGGIIFLVFLLIIPQLSSFLHIQDIALLFITDLIVLTSFVAILNIAFLQAKLAFVFQVSTNVVTSVTKLLLGSFFVLLGYNVIGAVSAIFLSAICGYIFSFFPLRSIFRQKESTPVLQTNELYSYGIPSALTLFGLTSFISADIILVKHFFSAEMAGIYAALSLVGRVIFYVSAPIGSVMFPIIVRKHSKNEKYSTTFILALLLVAIPSIMLTILYFLFPDFILPFFTRKTHEISIGPLLGLFGIFITLYCLLTVISNFYLSIKKTNVYIPVLCAAGLQILLICFYHESFFQIIIISMIITFLLVVGLLLYYPYATKKQV